MTKYRGFTLIEVMVTLGVVSATALAGLSLNNYLLHASTHSERRSALSSLERIVMQQLNDPTLCQAALGSGNSAGNKISIGAPMAVSLKIPQLHSGATQSDTELTASTVIAPLKLTVVSVEVADSVKTQGLGAVTNLYLQVKDSDGFSYRRELVSGLVITTAADGATIDRCHGNSLQDSAQLCSDMGCTYNTAAIPACTCAVTVPKLCPGPVQYPISYGSDGKPQCLPLGQVAPCPSGSYITGVQLNHLSCAPLPTATPTPGPTAGPGCWAITKYGNASLTIEDPNPHCLTFGACGVLGSTNLTKCVEWLDGTHTGSAPAGGYVTTCSDSSIANCAIAPGATPTPGPTASPTPAPTGTPSGVVLVYGSGFHTALEVPGVDYPSCPGPYLETMSPAVMVYADFTFHAFNPPYPPGTTCIIWNMNGSFPSISTTYAFMAGPIINVKNLPLTPAFPSGTCEPPGTVLPQEAKSCLVSGNTSYCCSGSFTCSASNDVTCN